MGKGLAGPFGIVYLPFNLSFRCFTQFRTASWTYLAGLKVQHHIPFSALCYLSLAPRYMSGSPIDSGFSLKYLSILLITAMASWSTINTSST